VSHVTASLRSVHHKLTLADRGDLDVVLVTFGSYD
jgi:hypothetical protein